MRIKTRYNFLIVPFIFFVLFSLPVKISAQEIWKTIELDKTGAIISFPQQPSVRSKELMTSLGNQTATSYTYQPSSESPNFLYSAQVIEYPQGTFPEDSLDLIQLALKETVESLSANLKCKIIYQDISVEGKNSRIFRLEDAVSRQTVKGKVILLNNYMITLTVFTWIDKSLNSRVDQFLTSFYIK